MSLYIYYVAIYNNTVIGKYRFNEAYNNLLELAELVSRKIYKMYKPKNFTFEIIDVQQKVTYVYNTDLTYFTFLEYGDYRIHGSNDCYTYRHNFIMPTLIDTKYPDMKVDRPMHWDGEYIPGLQRDDTFNYITGKLY